MERENLLQFIRMCKVFELEITVSQISPVMVKAFKDAKLFDLLPIERREYLKELFSSLKSNPTLYGEHIGKSAIMLLCMSETKAERINKVKNAALDPKKPNQIDFVCINCGNIVKSESAPPKQGCCTYENYIKNII